MKIRDRIVEFKRIPASELMPNPRNWRTHPTNQADALRGILSEVGYAGAVLVRETKHGYQLIDGHLRAETTPHQEIPCLVLDVTEAEANKLLATYDPIGDMAGVNPAILDSLLRDVETGSEALSEMIAELAEESDVVPRDDIAKAPEDFKEVDENIHTDHHCPKCGYEWSGGQ